MPLRRLSYFHGLFPSLKDANPGGADMAVHLSAAALPPWVVDLFDYEGIAWTPSEIGFPGAAVDTVEVDDLRFEVDEHEGHVRVINCAFGLMGDDNPVLARLHRFLSSLRHLTSTGGTSWISDRPDIHVPDELDWSRVGPKYMERNGIVARLLDSAADDQTAFVMPASGREVPVSLRDYVSTVGDALDDPSTGFVLFNRWSRNPSAVERLVERASYQDESEAAYVLARLNSPITTVFEVTETVPGHGLRIRHLIEYDGLDESWVVDDNASLHFSKGAVGFARLLRFDEFTMPAGMPAPLNEDAADQVLKTISDFVKVTAPELTSRTIQQFIGIASAVAYFGQFSGDRPDPYGNRAPAAPHGKTGRNDPCPCGSGRKYKHCCRSSLARA